jgi:uncharacterized protein YcbK (DUF882 family)
MGDLTKNISRHEVSCRCGCGSDSIDAETIEVVQECCDHFSDITGSRVVAAINSGNRCLGHNRSIGSRDSSQHPKGRAIDFRIVNVDPADVYKYLDERYSGKYGVGNYPTFTHLDTRTNGGSRW